MKLAIMQPYLFPYVGYFQLMSAVDEFVIYDNIQFTKKGWINRNRILSNGKEEYISFPLKKDSDYLDVKERELAGSWPTERKKMLNRITEAYNKAPYFSNVYPLVEKIILYKDFNLFRYIFNSLETLKQFFNIQTPIVVSSELTIDHNLKAENKVIAICKIRNANTYINPIGGIDLYKKDHFLAKGISLYFLQPKLHNYKQFNNNFIPGLSIIDMLMFNSKEQLDYFFYDYGIIK